jgi:serine/threonine protein phosphatase PrpC
MLNGFLEVSRAIGDFDRELQSKTRGLTAHPDTHVMDITDEDEFVIVACDGLWDVLDSHTAVQYARAHLLRYNSIQLVSEALVHEALRRHSDDNVTVIVIGFRHASASSDQVVAIDADVIDLPAHAPGPKQEEDFLLASPSSSALRPRFCASGISKLNDLLD